MVNIKSTEEIINKYRKDSIKSGYLNIPEAMKEYAAQFIELAAEEAILAWNNTPHKRGYPWFAWNPNGLEEAGDKCITVDRKSILKLKEQIK